MSSTNYAAPCIWLKQLIACDKISQLIIDRSVHKNNSEDAGALLFLPRP